MPAYNKTQLSLHMTRAEKTAILAAAEINGVSVSEFLRRAAANRCAAFGVEYVTETQERGKYERVAR